jgi:hypothetical protein
MFDDLRQEVNAAHEEEKKPKVAAEPAPQVVAAPPKQRKRSKKILGMTGSQRFAISFMLMLMVCVTGFMFLLITGKMGF